MADGQGGYIKIYNATATTMKKGDESKSNMDSWSLPDTISAEFASTFKVQFSYDNPPKDDKPYTKYPLGNNVTLELSAYAYNDDTNGMDEVVYEIAYQFLWTPGGEPLTAPFLIHANSNENPVQWKRQDSFLHSIGWKSDKENIDVPIEIQIIEVDEYADKPQAYGVVTDVINCNTTSPALATVIADPNINNI